jgi:hypothetical protein
MIDMPTATTIQNQDHLKLIKPELIALCTKWGLWKGLFTDKDAVKALNNASGLASMHFSDSMLKDVVLGLARLLDPPTQGGYENASIAHIAQDDFPAGLKTFQSSVKAIRNKRLAHNDAASMQEQLRVHYGVSDTQVDEALKQIIEIVNKAEVAKTDAGTAYDYCEDQGRGAAKQLVRALGLKKECHD